MVALVLAAASWSCARTRASRPAEPPESTRAGAALASVVVRNETQFALVVAFRPAVPPGGEIVVGRVQAGGESRLAPVPAGEPIILVARTVERTRFELGPRTFDIDSEWVWRIPADAAFRGAGDDRRP